MGGQLGNWEKIGRECGGKREKRGDNSRKCEENARKNGMFLAPHRENYMIHSSLSINKASRKMGHAGHGPCRIGTSP